jgi:hypothetical protein
MDIRSKEFPVRAEIAEVTPQDLELINSRFALRPLTAGEVYVRRLALCNDQYDRTSERFPRYYLERFAETLPGKPLLANHERRQFPLGRFFKAEVVTGAPTHHVEPATEDQAPGTVDRGPRTLDRRPETWLCCWIYLVKTSANEEVRTQIDGGVYSHVSIGYRWADLTCDLCGRSYFRGDCPHVIDQEYDGRRCTATYSGDPQRVEAVEGSLVYLGAQYGAVITKSDDRRVEKETIAGRAPADASLAADGRLYRTDLRAEVLRLARCVNAGAEGEALLEALGEVPAERLKRLVADYQARFDGIFPPAAAPEDAAEPTRRVRLQLQPL